MYLIHFFIIVYEYFIFIYFFFFTCKVCVYIYIIFINVSQEKLNGLTILSIEQDLLENIEYKSLINNFNIYFY